MLEILWKPLSGTRIRFHALVIDTAPTKELESRHRATSLMFALANINQRCSEGMGIPALSPDPQALARGYRPAAQMSESRCLL